MKREELTLEIGAPLVGHRIVVCRRIVSRDPGRSRLEQRAREGDSPVLGLELAAYDKRS